MSVSHRADRFLHDQGCDTNTTNTFGCNAVLWCAQGTGDTLRALQWLDRIGCNVFQVNTNGHGALHKAAQRGHTATIEWLVPKILSTDPNLLSFGLFGPDQDDCCPSDLAGTEGHDHLAKTLVIHEASMCQHLLSVWIDNGRPLPSWLNRRQSVVCSSTNTIVWEPFAGIHRLQQVYRDYVGRLETLGTGK